MYLIRNFEFAMFEEISPVFCIIVANFITAPFYIIAQESTTEPAIVIEDKPEPEASIEVETPEPTTIPPTTTRTARPTEPMPNFTIPDDDKGRKFRDNFAMYNCELLKRCNVIPQNRTCGRDWFYGTIAWFQNICVLWKTNCLQLGLFSVQNKAMCEDFYLMYPDKLLWLFTYDMIEPSPFSPYAPGLIMRAVNRKRRKTARERSEAGREGSGADRKRSSAGRKHRGEGREPRGARRKHRGECREGSGVVSRTFLSTVRTA